MFAVPCMGSGSVRALRGLPVLCGCPMAQRKACKQRMRVIREQRSAARTASSPRTAVLGAMAAQTQSSIIRPFQNSCKLCASSWTCARGLRVYRAGAEPRGPGSIWPSLPIAAASWTASTSPSPLWSFFFAPRYARAFFRRAHPMSSSISRLLSWLISWVICHRDRRAHPTSSSNEQASSAKRQSTMPSDEAPLPPVSCACISSGARGGAGGTGDELDPCTSMTPTRSPLD